jgi:hypothetical protein
MQLIWLKLFEYPKSIILCVMEEASVFVRHLLALLESSAVDWVTKELSINFWEVKVFFHFQSIKTTSEASSGSYPVHTQGKVAGPGSIPCITV